MAGLFLKVPAGVPPVTSGDALSVPAYMVLAELDAFVDSTALIAAFVASRGAGALWGLAKELAVPHHSLSPAATPGHDRLVEHHPRAALGGYSRSEPLSEIAETSGWLGDRATGEAAPWVSFPGDRASASWIPSESTAGEWEIFDCADTHAFGGQGRRRDLRGRLCHWVTLSPKDTQRGGPAS